MNYSDNPAMVRVDFFKPSGTWYTTEAVQWTGAWVGKEQSIIDAFAKSLRDHFGINAKRLSGMDAVCLEPYHEHAHPIQIKNGSWNTTT